MRLALIFSTVFLISCSASQNQAQSELRKVCEYAKNFDWNAKATKEHLIKSYKEDLNEIVAHRELKKMINAIYGATPEQRWSLFEMGLDKLKISAESCNTFRKDLQERF